MTDEPDVVYSVLESAWGDSYLVLEATVAYQRILAECPHQEYAQFIVDRLNAAAAAGGGSTSDQAALEAAAAEVVATPLRPCARCGAGHTMDADRYDHLFEPRREEESSPTQR